MSTIKNFIKEKKREILLALLLFLVISLSFGLGYLFANTKNQTPIIIEKATNN